MKKYISHDYEQSYPFNRAEIEKMKDAKFVGEFCLFQRGWVNNPVEVYYQPNSTYPCPYFGLLIQHGQVFITSAESTIGIPIYGVVANDGEVIYSRYRHDFRQSKDGSVFIDGGRDYTKTNTNNGVVMTIKDGSLQIVEDEIEIKTLEENFRLLTK
jgi:hypothetical protein